MASIIASFLVGLIVGVLIFAKCETEVEKARISAGVWVHDGRAYRITPMEDKTHE